MVKQAEIVSWDNEDFDQYEIDKDEKGEASSEAKQKHRRVFTRTLVPGLIHLVKDDDAVVKYLRKVDEELRIDEYFKDGGKIYRPKQDLPIEYVTKNILELVPKKKIVPKGILDQVMKFIRRYLYLPHDQDYLVLALWVFHTYLIESFNVTPILYFFGTKETGKTRAGEVLGKIAYRCERLTSPTEASLFRSANLFKTCLVIDEIKLWGADGNKEVASLIKSRYKRGMKVSRVNLNRNGENQLEYYDVFAPLVICTTETMPPIIESRCISFIMQQNIDKEIEKDIDEKDALMVRELLTIFKYLYIDSELPDVEAITRRRLNEITKPLLQICEIVDPSRKGELVDFVKYLEMCKAEEDGESTEADILKCLLEIEDLIQSRKFATTAVLEVLNRNQDPKNQYNSRYISSCIKRMGFEKTRLHGGKMAWKYNEQLMKQLLQKYRIEIEKTQQGEA